ncbi:MAG: HAMP domain-containing sensor histidine kinase, partial [Fulvivirga sp.]|nr:HAMP domain-containing sensor histidine kinase [Fulvivirga sp.]
QYDYLKMIRESLLKLDNFIEDINAFYRNEKLAVRNEKIELEALIKEEIENLRGTWNTSDDIKINYNITQVSVLFSDKIRLKTIITNLLSNTIKYRDCDKPFSYVDIDFQVTPDTCVIQVKDNGIGIKDEHLNCIFDIFYRADDNAKGSGLGLYIVKDTIDKLNGQVEVESEYGKGTAFTITIPNFLNAK